MPLISLEEWERLNGQQRADALETMYLDRPNGISCPRCEEELVDCDRSEILTSFPPKYRIHCLACDWRGYRTI